MRRSYLLAAAVLVAALSTASLLAGIRHALGKRESVKPQLTPREEERRRIREALGDMLAPPIDFNNWPEHLRPTADMPDRDTLRRSLPRSKRPAWHDIREDRDARG
jgi:hypothetical protein